MATPDPRIAAYVAELSTPSVASYSHHTLRRLYLEHGVETIDALLAAHWAADPAITTNRTEETAPCPAL